MSKKEFCKDQSQQYINFMNGILAFGTYSYEIDSWGDGELSKMDTRKLYEAMKEYYNEI